MRPPPLVVSSFRMEEDARSWNSMRRQKCPARRIALKEERRDQQDNKTAWVYGEE
ncbi:hypothetical protein PVAP13_4KG053500 [Panicum virgatum]|uniref:Uncharacterized protein n=1 Tax=Panicum virgatum TaxID=38727 RepID=A0A8T0TF68_PANVG|nr:hypothetical protein PVAP13_4KG053500 [Panicum virgatum]